ncbi:hypothetical protein NCAS_0F00310 [Naumovozyma castellii]|uniref:Zn(2)-C6 fungal-type domain-containing protein n=1 Tax=Naumovozyma castellii TaxID=27288 RepID=G0VG95_NAUCA|nr:hypothetical protein NCAS_0F00310 [Naumovozyma castellii CBS 4309]CCC70515.1 hypothetical protein NCAS_0F00310 [Naumovozyma castellii CBS 4309]
MNSRDLEVEFPSSQRVQGGRPLETSPLSDSTKQPKKKRRKPITSCAFCRQRKLKCDQKRPICSTCIGRKLTTCVYADDNLSPNDSRYTGPHSVGSSNSSHGTESTTMMQAPPPNDLMYDSESELVERVKYSEKQLELVQNQDTQSSTSHSVPVGSTTKETCINPFKDFYFLQNKSYGRRILYGPTSMKTFIKKNHWGFLTKYNQLWSKVKIERTKWKKKRNISNLKELTMIEVDGNPNVHNLIAEVCTVLPTYEKTTSILESFFSEENYDLYELRTILDKNKVMTDFYTAFTPSTQLLPNGEKLIANLTPNNRKKNYYKIGVILMILAFAHYSETIPNAIYKFFIMLTGFTTGKTSYVERAQFLLLRHCYSQTFRNAGDNTHNVIIADLLSDAGITLGLNLDIKRNYFRQENEVGPLDLLENLWVWIVYADFDVAFLNGRPLTISTAHFNEQTWEVNPTDVPAIAKMKRFLKLARPMVNDFYNPNICPNLESFCENLLVFVENEFPPISYFTDKELISKVDVRSIRIFSSILRMLVSFYSLRFAVLMERSIDLKNHLIQTILISFSLVINCTVHFFEIDRKRFPEMLREDYPNITPYLGMSLSVINGLYPRVLSVFCALIYFKLTLFENGLLLAFDLEPQTWKLNTLRVPHNSSIHLMSSYNMYCQIFDSWYKADPDLKLVMARSHSFVIALALERTYRTVLEKTIEYRRRTEETWMSQIQKELDPTQMEEASNSVLPITNGSSSVSLSPPSLAAPPPIPNPKPPMGPSLVNVGMDPGLQPHLQNVAGTSITTTSSQTLPNVENLINAENQPEIQPEIAQMVSDDFWESYNIGWNQLINQPDPAKIFADIKQELNL